MEQQTKETKEKKKFKIEMPDNVKKVLKPIGMAAGAIVAFWLGAKYDEHCVSGDFNQLYKDGYIKFFDGEGNECGFKEAQEAINKKY